MRVFPLALVLVSVAAGCGPSLPDPVTPVDTMNQDQTTRCRVERDQARPMLVEWPAADKAALEAQSADQVVMVAYEGCQLRLLPGCGSSGGYEFRPTTPARDSMQLESEDDLYTKLPLGAASLEAEIQRGNTLSVDYVVVGQRRALSEPTTESATGECSGATHFVRAMVVGAYELKSQSAASGRAGANAFGAGAGGGRREEQRVLRANGDIAGCSSAPVSAEAPDARCMALLQLDLAPIRPAGSAPQVRPPEPVVASGGTAAPGETATTPGETVTTPRETFAPPVVEPQPREVRPEPEHRPTPPVASAPSLPGVPSVEVRLMVPKKDEGVTYDAEFLTDAGAVRCPQPLTTVSPCIVRVPAGPARLSISGDAEFQTDTEIGGRGEILLVETQGYWMLYTGLAMFGLGAGLVTSGIIVAANDSTGDSAYPFVSIFFGGSLTIAGLVLGIVDLARKHGWARSPDEERSGGFGILPF